jgi:hypothetical protein
MSNVLDVIIRKVILQGPETVNADFLSDSFDISGAEGDFAVQLIYDNGVSVNMNLYLQVSTDNTNFSDIDGSGQNVTDSDHSHIWDVSGTGTSFARVRIEVLSGSIDIQRINFDGKRRH